MVLFFVFCILQFAAKRTARKAASCHIIVSASIAVAALLAAIAGGFAAILAAMVPLTLIENIAWCPPHICYALKDSWCTVFAF
jgi:hypothetical protein